MIKIENTDYLMGSTGWTDAETPIHNVSLTAFLLDETLVTNAEFAHFVNETGYKTDAENTGAAWGFKDGKYQVGAGLNWRSFASEDRQQHPVVLVSWYDANAYATWQGKRLPTEAEWECAARAGLVDKLYSWGDESPDGRCNWNQAASERPATAPVKSFAPNEFGLHDMVGNTWQWINDWYDDAYYQNSPDVNPTGPATGTFKVRRGASFNVIQSFRLRNSNRGSYDPKIGAINIGFRCAKSIE